MKDLNLTLKTATGTQPVSFKVKRMVNAGYVGRDQETVVKHIEELKKEGVPAPDEVPTLYPVAPYLITTEETLEPIDDYTSGEAEFVLFLEKDKMYVGAGSDHTDRKLEAASIVKAKQMCPNVVSSVVWPYDEVKRNWDELILRSWTEKDGQRILYQEARLASILTIEDLLAFIRSRVKDEDFNNMVIYSGTIPLLGGEAIFGDSFEVELHNPETGDSLWCRYQVKPMDYL
ncbi:MAG: DUF2848 family protein [Dehalococcoidales bacterium]|nr:DUF2848 family protein [Dehalococcoidales bacterium]